MSQQQGFGTGGGGGGGDVKSICVSENALAPSGTFLAPPICIFPDADGSISFTADPPIILTAIPNGLNISFSGSTGGGIGFIQGNDAVKVGPDSTQTIQVIGNSTQGVTVTNTGPNQITITVADATSTQKGVVTLGEAGNGIVSINNIAPDAMSNFNITATTPYTITPITNGINLSDNGSIPYTYTTASGTNPFVNNNLSVFVDNNIGEFFTRNNSIGLRINQATYDRYGLALLASDNQVLNGDNDRVVTTASLRALTGPLTANTVLISTGSHSAITNSSVGTAGQGLFSKGGASIPDFGSFTSLDNTLAIVYNSMDNSLDFRVTGSLPGTPNIEFIAGNDNVNVPPDSSTHVIKVIGDNTQGVNVTKTGTNELTVTVGDATATQKGVVLLGEVSSGITTINSVPPNSASNFNITATAPYTVTPGTNSVNIGDNGGIPYQFVPDTGNPVAVTGNSFTFKGNDPIYTQVFDFQPTNYYIGIKTADYGFLGSVKLAFNQDVLGGTSSSAVTCASLRALMGPLTKYTVLLANDNTHQIQNSSVGTDGQVFFGNTGNFPDFGTLISSSGNVTFVYNSTAKTMDVNANIPVDSLPLVVVSSSQPLLTNNAYMFTAGSDSYALPATSAVNDLLELKVQGASSYTITQADGQSIFLGNTNTTVGTSGSLMCNGPGDWIRLRCTVANTTWVEFGMSAQSFIVN